MGYVYQKGIWDETHWGHSVRNVGIIGIPISNTMKCVLSESGDMAEWRLFSCKG